MTSRKLKLGGGNANSLDININNISEALNDKADRNILNLDNTGQSIIDYKANIDLSNLSSIGESKLGRGNLIESYVSGVSWYRLYADGWCEQGGYAKGSVKTVFLKSFKDTNYTVVLGKYSDSTSGQTMALSYLGRFSALARDGFTLGAVDAQWVAYGYTTSTPYINYESPTMSANNTIGGTEFACYNNTNNPDAYKITTDTGYSVWGAEHASTWTFWFPKPTSIYQMNWTNAGAYGSVVGTVTQWKVSTSTNGTDWVDVGTFDSANQAVNQPTYINFGQTVTTQYIRIEYTAGIQGGYHNTHKLHFIGYITP